MRVSCFSQLVTMRSMAYLFRKTSSTTIEVASNDAFDYLATCKLGDDLLIAAKHPRNYKFHKKIFALVKWAYLNVDHPEVFHEGEKLAIDIESFRSELIILAGFRSVVVHLDQTISYRADSLSYDKCSAAKAKRIYSAMLDVISLKLFDNIYSPQHLEEISGQYLSFC